MSAEPNKQEQENKKIVFHALSPIDNAKVDTYEKALLWAIRNRKKEDIKNVALTGPYGSGKSSILKTFEKKYDKEFSFLNLSLATFKEELKNKVGEKHTKKDEDILRLIELSILQQIFYHEEDKTIPDSRFKKIKSFKRKNLFLVAASLLILLISGFNIFAPETFRTEFHLHLSETPDIILHFFCMALFLTGVYIILVPSVRLINGIRISKVKFQDTEIEIDKGISKSVLNNHFDEIIYFFEVTSYNVVIIEDLDRFQQTEIFTKLRELNLLINNSKKIKREIVFIYAVRDDMFHDKDRTKFFDFIVPVIPVINASNSNDMLRDIRKQNENITEELIDDIGLFIDDMRLLYNIENEYFVYAEILDIKLDPNKLLSMIVYKNIYPNDFVELSDDKGKLYSAISSRNTLIKEAETKLNEQIAAHKAEVKQLAEITLTNATELRKLYVNEAIANLDNFGYFIATGNTYKVGDLSGEAAFEHLRNNQLRYKAFAHQYDNNYRMYEHALPDEFAKIEKRVDSSKTYAERAKLVNGAFTNRTELLKGKISELETKKMAIRNQKLAELLRQHPDAVQIQDAKQKSLVMLLLRNGYIDEDYQDYTSIFYAGSITKEDRQFLLNVKSGILTAFDHSLSKLPKLTEKIAALHFSEGYILNYKLMDYLLTLDEKNEKLLAVLKQLAIASQRALEFIDGYLGVSKSLPDFIRLLVKQWPNYWSVISTQETFTNERAKYYYELLLKFADQDDIMAVIKCSDLEDFIDNDVFLLQRDVEDQKLIGLIHKIPVKPYTLNFEDVSEAVFNEIYQYWLYRINTENIIAILEHEGKYDPIPFELSNYQFIQDTGLDQLAAYLTDDHYIDSYISNIYFELKDNGEVVEGNFVDLLRKPNISDENKLKIIERSRVYISDLVSVDEKYYSELVKQKKVEATWPNIWKYFENSGLAINDTLLDYLNTSHKAAMLSKTVMPAQKEEQKQAVADKFEESLLSDNRITDDLYREYVKSIPLFYNELVLKGLSAEKVKALIKQPVLDITRANFDEVKQYQRSLLHLFLETNQDELITNLTEFAFTDDELLTVLEAPLTEENKFAVYLSVLPERLQRHDRLARQIGELLIQFPDWAANIARMEILLDKPLSMPEKIQLFNTRFHQFSREEALSIIVKWLSPYSEATKPGKRPVIPFGTENQYLANNLEKLKIIKRSEPDKHGIRLFNVGKTKI